MDKMTLLGTILGIIAVGVGMVLKGVNPVALLNPAAALIIFLGTAAAVMNAFPTEVIKKVPALFRIIFTEAKEKYHVPDLINSFSKWSDIARQEGILALEAQLQDIKDPFLGLGLRLVIDGQSQEFIRDVLSEEIDAMEERHAAGAGVFRQAGTYAPTLGVLGAVIGLIAALANMGDTEVIGHAIAAAFVATLFGIFTGYVLWHPFANKLVQKSKQEIFVKTIIIEGVLSIQEGQSGRMIKEKLASYLPTKDRKNFLEEKVEE